MSRLAPYAKQHEDPKGPGDARPTATQIINDQNLVESLSWKGKVVLVTGCSPGGIGPETAKALHLTGADVFITVRDLTKGKQVVDEILADGKPGKVEAIQMDLNSLKSIRAGAEEFLNRSGNKLNILIANAGIMGHPQGKTEDGFELHFGTNHLGHFYLFHLLKPALLASASPTFNSRVVVVSSVAHRNTTINFSDLFFEDRPYDPNVAYGQSKLANTYFANELDRRYRDQNLRALSLHPGGIMTPIVKHLPGAKEMFESDPEIAKTLKTPAQGAATTVWAAVAKELEGKGGLYLHDVAVAEPAPEGALYYAGGYSKHAFDPESERRLWEESLKLVGLSE